MLILLFVQAVRGTTIKSNKNGFCKKEQAYWQQDPTEGRLISSDSRW
jgi:hypothetical protein